MPCTAKLHVLLDLQAGFDAAEMFGLPLAGVLRGVVGTAAAT